MICAGCTGVTWFSPVSWLLLCCAGFTLIVGVLGRGLHALYTGNKAVSYRMMRYRVLFQVGTVFALIFGMVRFFFFFFFSFHVRTRISQ